MGILGEENDCMLAKNNLIKNNGRKMLLWKQELLSSFQKGGGGGWEHQPLQKNIQLHVKKIIIYFIVKSSSLS